MTSTSDRIRRVATALAAGDQAVDPVDAAEILRRIADELPPPYPTGGSPEQLASMGVPEVLWPAVHADLALVDQLQQRLRAMPLPQPGRAGITAADMFGPLFAETRHSMVAWYSHQWRTLTTTPPSMIVPGRVD